MYVELENLLQAETHDDSNRNDSIKVSIYVYEHDIVTTTELP